MTQYITIKDLGDVLYVVTVHQSGKIQMSTFEKKNIDINVDAEKQEITIVSDKETMTFLYKNVSLPVTTTLADFSTLLNSYLESGTSAVNPVKTGTPVNAVANSATFELSGGIEFSDTITIGDKMYTFKDALGTPVEGIAEEGDVYFGTNATEALLNLLNAINHTGTAGTDYICAEAHPTVIAVSSDSSTLVVEDRIKGVSGNGQINVDADIVGTSSAWTETSLTGGVDGTVGKAGEIYIKSTKDYAYIATADNLSTTANWRKYSLATL